MCRPFRCGDGRGRKEQRRREGEGEEEKDAEKDAGKPESRCLSSRSVSVRTPGLGRPTQKAKPSSSSSYALELKAGEAESHSGRPRSQDPGAPDPARTSSMEWQVPLSPPEEINGFCLLLPFPLFPSCSHERKKRQSQVGNKNSKSQKTKKRAVRKKKIARQRERISKSNSIPESRPPAPLSKVTETLPRGLTSPSPPPPLRRLPPFSQAGTGPLYSPCSPSCC